MKVKWECYILNVYVLFIHKYTVPKLLEKMTAVSPNPESPMSPTASCKSPTGTLNNTVSNDHIYLPLYPPCTCPPSATLQSTWLTENRLPVN